MIEIKILDKHGVELKNGDTIKYASITPIYENGDFWAGQNGVKINWGTYLIDPQSDADDFFSFFIPNAIYDKSELIRIFDFRECSDEEYQGILDEICESLNIEFTSESDLLEKISGFEVVK